MSKGENLRSGREGVELERGIPHPGKNRRGSE